MSAPVTEVRPGALLASVVVPSFNRRDTLEMVVAALAEQRGVARDAFEVIVVLDGSTDGSGEMLAAWERGGRLARLRPMWRENAGQAAARDAGARVAEAPVLIFLDDDVVPEPDLVAAHLAWHARGERIAVLGDCEIVRHDGDSLYAQHTWSWWEQMYSNRARPGRVPCYTDFCAGNVSLRRDDYLASGGFDPAFRGYGGEDYDLGYRLLRAGVRFVADRGVRAMHHHRFPSYEKLLRARRQEGHADVLLARKHPALRAGLRLMRLAQRPGAHAPRPRLTALALSARGMSAWEWRRRIRLTTLWERLDRRGRWAVALAQLNTYAYQRGVYEALGSEAAVDAFAAEATVPGYVLDVTHGIPETLPGFWVDGPSDVHVTAGGVALGTVTLPGPVQLPLREALVPIVRDRLGAALWTWAEGTGTSLLSERAAG